MYQTTIVIQYISIVCLFIESWIVLWKWNSRLHAYLFFGCATNLVNNVGYLFELKATTEESYLTALKISYCGRIWIALALFLFATELCGVKINNLLKTALALFHTAIYIVVLAVPYTDLYYKNVHFEMDGEFPHLVYKSGIVHYMFTAMLILYILVGIVILIVSHRRERDKTTRSRIMVVIIIMIIESVFVVFQRFRLLEIANHYDLTMMGTTLGNLMTLFAIVRYKLLGTEQLAKNYITEKLSEGIIAVNPDGKVAYFNKPAVTLFPELESDPTGVVGKIDRSISNGEAIHLNGHIYTPKTETLKENDDVSATVYVLQDNTEMYIHTKELEEMTERANAANAAKSRFLSSMSHEIRTPINAVLGMDEMILRESREHEIITYAEDIQNAGRTLLSLINDILDFSKIEEGKMEIVTTQYDLASVINDLVNMVEQRAEKKGLKFETEVDRNIPYLLYGDEIRIKQCALNILTNAVKYTEKGSVTFTVGYEEVDSGHILLTMRVKDTGIGMKQEDMDKLFSPFVRIEEERNINIEGTGLGMSITRQLLELMNSRLDVSSVYGEGSEFSFSIVQEIAENKPIGDYSQRTRKNVLGNEYRELFHAPDAKILVVDDTPVNLSVIKGLLKKTKITVDTANGGAEALAAAASQKYDIIFIDHMMPEMDGIETLYELRKQPGNKDTVCIALTANAISGAREMYLKDGFSDYLSKPVDSKKLEMMLKEYLPPEKILSAKDDEQTDAAGDNSAIAKLRRMNEIDVDKGLDYCSEEELYLDTVSFFAESVSENAAEIESLWRSGNVEGTVIKIHALKSTSRLIGASSLSEYAKELEEAGKKGELSVIDDELDRLLEMYRGLGAELSETMKGVSRNNDDLRR